MPVTVQTKAETQIDFPILLRRLLLKMHVSSCHREHLTEQLGGYKTPQFYEEFFRRKRDEQPLLFGEFVQSALRVANNYAVRNELSPVKAPSEFRNLYSALMKVAYEQPLVSVQ